jgi:hypothetical protein
LKFRNPFLSKTERAREVLRIVTTIKAKQSKAAGAMICRQKKKKKRCKKTVVIHHMILKLAFTSYLVWPFGCCWQEEKNLVAEI